jgi:Mg2+ and Co2+ transporter CorA
LLFAQLQTVDPVFLQQLLVVVLCAISAVTSIGAFVNGRKRQAREIEPQPLEVRAADQFVNREFCKQIHMREADAIAHIRVNIEKIEREVRENREHFQKELMEELGKVHDRINEILEAVAELRGARNKDRP